MRLKSLSLATMFVLVSLVVGCGDDDNGGAAQTDAPSSTNTQKTTTTTTTPPSTASHALTIRMSEYAFDPQDAVAKKGQVTITAPNDGQIVHELVHSSFAAGSVAPPGGFWGACVVNTGSPSACLLGSLFLNPAAGLGPLCVDETFLPVGGGVEGCESGELAAQLEADLFQGPATGGEVVQDRHAGL